MQIAHLVDIFSLNLVGTCRAKRFLLVDVFWGGVDTPAPLARAPKTHLQVPMYSNTFVREKNQATEAEFQNFVVQSTEFQYYSCISA